MKVPTRNPLFRLHWHERVATLGRTTIFVSFLLVSILSTTNAVACEMPPEDAAVAYAGSHFAQATYVVSGTVSTAVHDPATRYETASVEVDRVYKGQPPEVLEIKHFIRMCGGKLPLGERVFLFLTLDSIGQPTHVVHVRVSHAPADFGDRLEAMARSPAHQAIP